jgi:hypothetical protein
MVFQNDRFTRLLKEAAALSRDLPPRHPRSALPEQVLLPAWAETARRRQTIQAPRAEPNYPEFKQSLELRLQGLPRQLPMDKIVQSLVVFFTSTKHSPEVDRRLRMAASTREMNLQDQHIYSALEEYLLHERHISPWDVSDVLKAKGRLIFPEVARLGITHQRSLFTKRSQG